MMTQSEKSALFRKLHTGPELLLLPNIWDTLSAKLIASLGFPSLATASISVAAVNGYPDGEKIPMSTLLQVVSQISNAVDLPVSVDFERGFSTGSAKLSDNIKQLLDAGAIGINIEDGLAGKPGVESISHQCQKIEVIRNTAAAYGVDMVINARTDVYLQRQSSHPLDEAIERGRAYQQAGADCFYPILIDTYDDVQAITEAVSIPVNTLLIKPLGDLHRLKKIGVKRVSLGPGTLKYMLTKLRNMVTDLQHYKTDAFFDEALMSSDDLSFLIS